MFIDGDNEVVIFERWDSTILRAIAKTGPQSLASLQASFVNDSSYCHTSLQKPEFVESLTQNLCNHDCLDAPHCGSGGSVYSITSKGESALKLYDKLHGVQGYPEEIKRLQAFYYPLITIAD